MASSYSVEKTDVAGVLEWFELQNHVNWFIYHSKPENIYYYHKGGDLDESAAVLFNVLNTIKNDGNKNVYILKLEAKNKTTKESPRIIFRLNTESVVNGMSPVFNPNNNEILSRLAAIENKLDDEELEEDEEEEKMSINGIISGMLQQPQMQQVILNFISNIAGNLVTPKVQAVAGVNDDQLNDILNLLFKKGVKVEHLKKLSEMPEAKIQMLISML